MNLERAIQVALSAHNNQKDLAGKPYILHPLWVMSRFDDISHQIVAVLHDVVEDSTTTLSDLRVHLNDECFEALSLLTKWKGADYYEYVERIKFSQNKLAIDIKIEDLKHNLMHERLGDRELTDVEVKRLEKYSKALYFLQNTIPCMTTYPDKVYPDFVKFKDGLAFRRTSVQNDNSFAIYYRDGGKWEIDASFFSDGLYSRWCDDYNIGNTDKLDMQKMIECTEEDYAKNNGGYYKQKK